MPETQEQFPALVAHYRRSQPDFLTRQSSDPGAEDCGIRLELEQYGLAGLAQGCRVRVAALGEQGIHALESRLM